MNKTLTTIFALAVASVTAFSHAQEAKGDVKAGEKKIAMCIGCHGIPGYQSSFPEVHKVPMISGQSGKYIASALDAYKKGDRKHPSMRGIATSMTEQDIADVAAFYAAQGKVEGAAALPAPREPSAQVGQLLQKGACVSCHGANFSESIDPSYPKIAGQHPDYLYVALKAYRDNTNATWGRGNPIMAGMAKQFSNAELKAMAQYIGNLPGELKTVPQSKFR